MSKGTKKPLIMEIAAFLVALFTFVFAISKYFTKSKTEPTTKKKIVKKRK